MSEDQTTLRELVREIHTDVKYLRSDFQDTKKDHEKRLRTVEKGMWGILATSLTGVGAFVRSIFTGH